MHTRLWLFTLLLLASCTGGNSPADPAGATAASSAAGSTVAVTVNAATTVVPTTVAPTIPRATPTATNTPKSERTFHELGLFSGDLRVYPAPFIVAGDRVTFQVVPTVPEAVNPRDVSLTITIDGAPLIDGTLNVRTLSGRPQGLYEWAWTATAGRHTATAVLDPEDRIAVGDADPTNNAVSVTFDVLPCTAEVDCQPAPAPAWVTVETDNAVIHAVSGTAAHRDLDELVRVTDAAIAVARSALRLASSEPVPIYFVDRIFGQGGYAAQSVVITYTDRNYAGGGLFEVVVHEAVHVLDAPFEPSGVPRFLVEGLAVWATGGHYKQEGLHQRAAAMLEADMYQPLPALIDNFYTAQHEAAYLQAGALVRYLVDQYGWEAVKAFYTASAADPSAAPSVRVSRAMETQFGATLTEVERDWLLFLNSYDYTRADVTDLITTVRQYNAVRQYQRTYDVAAHYLDAWLPYPEQLVDRASTAEVTRRADDPVRITLEVMLEASDLALRNTAYDTANVILSSVERVLESGTFVDPVAIAYYELTQTVAALGFELQKAEISENRAWVLAREPNTTRRLRLDMIRTTQGWIEAP